MKSLNFLQLQLNWNKSFATKAIPISLACSLVGHLITKSVTKGGFDAGSLCTNLISKWQWNSYVSPHFPHPSQFLTLTCCMPRDWLQLTIKMKVAHLHFWPSVKQALINMSCSAQHAPPSWMQPITWEYTAICIFKSQAKKEKQEAFQFLVGCH